MSPANRPSGGAPSLRGTQRRSNPERGRERLGRFAALAMTGDSDQGIHAREGLGMTDAIFDHSGSSFDVFLEQEGLLEESEASAVKRVVGWQLGEMMRVQGVSRQAMAERMGVSRAQLDRLLDPESRDVQLAALTQAARVLGKKLRIDVVDAS